jgi:hypothetical protein
VKYDINAIYSTKNDLEIKINQTGKKATIRDKGQENATSRQGFRVICGDETIGYGDWNQTEHDLLCETIKTERYAHLAYKEAYYDLLQKLSSIGFIQKNDDDGEECHD